MPAQTRSRQGGEQERNKKPAKKERDEDDMSVDEKDDEQEEEEEENPKKRKSPPTDPQEPTEKAPKQKSSSSAPTADKDSKKGGGGGPTTKQMLNYLLSADAIQHSYPAEDIEASSKMPKTYSMTPPSSFTPFEHLLVSHLLSKPLSHVLGCRSIRTLLNPPFTLSSPASIAQAGEHRVWEALEEARTQHRQKTAAYIYQTAQEYSSEDDQGDGEAMYELASEANESGAQGVIDHIKNTVNGMGQTGAEIFCRRIQCVDGWGEAIWPYADPKTLSALNDLGIEIQSGDELQSLVEEHVEWDKVGQMGLKRLTGTGREKEVEKEGDTGDDTGKIEDMDMEQKVQVEFVVLLERAVGAVLEGNVDKVREAAKNWS